MINFNKKKQAPAICEGKEKETMPFNMTFTLSNFEFATKDGNEYVIYTAREYPGKFFFGASGMLEICKELDAAGDAELMEVVRGNYKFVLTQVRTRSGRNYTQVNQVI